MNVKGIGKSHIGMIRSTNQDSYYIDNSRYIFMVADGMGGHAGGEIASQMCVDSIKQKLESNQSPLFLRYRFPYFS